MTHLFLCREYPPAPHPPGGIGTYVALMARLLADAGETVHVIAQRWSGASDAQQVFVQGRLIVHRVALDQAATMADRDLPDARPIRDGLLRSACPVQAFAWQGALLAEQLVEHDGVDVIEAPEWEAPLYYLLSRRALGLGPTRRPPCVVHLHSSTEQVYAANDWDRTVLDFHPMAALEAETIRAADALLCPSRYVAEQAAVRYGLAADRVTVIPYPVAATSPIERSDEIWTNGGICHVGRLEPRKGVIEWAEALSLAAPDGLSAHFAGGDTPLEVSGGGSVSAVLWARLSPGLRRRVHFHGSLDPAGLRQVLAGSWAAVVPSRWDNLPYACLEAMASGLPVIASPNGGMKELVEDGVSGWIAEAATPPALAHVLRRALATPAVRRREMGRVAAAALAACAGATIVRRHLELKRSLVSAAAHQASCVTAEGARAGIGVVVTAADEQTLVECLAGMAAQIERPRQVAVLCDSASDDTRRECTHQGWTVAGRRDAAVELSAAAAMIDADPSVGAVAFILGGTRLSPDALQVCAEAMAGDAAVGVVSAWTRSATSPPTIQMSSDPAAPGAGWPDGVPPFLMVRVDALRQVLTEALAGTSPSLPVSDLAALATAAGWRAVTYPRVLTTSSVSRLEDRAAAARYSAMARTVQRMHLPWRQWWRTVPAAERRRFVTAALRHPVRAVRQCAVPVGRAMRLRFRAPMAGL